MTAYYKLDHSEPGYLSQMLPRADGSWVKRADYDAALAAARAELERLTSRSEKAEAEVKRLLANITNLRKTWYYRDLVMEDFGKALKGESING